MRECFKCGYKEPVIWRNKRFRLNTMYCHISDLVEWNEELASRIVNNSDVKIGPYIYHLTKAGYVDRIHEDDSRDGVSYLEPDQEKAKHRKYSNPNQTKLGVTV